MQPPSVEESALAAHGQPSRRSVHAARRLGRLLAWFIAIALIQGCASLAKVDKAASYALPAQPGDPLALVAQTCMEDQAGSALRPMTISDFAMDARLTLARNAQRSIDVQYYLLQNDATGRTLLRALRDAARRGVRVRLLVDDMYTASSDELLMAFAAHPNVQVRLFNPFPSGRAFSSTRWAFSLLDFARVNHRMHNKLFIADGVMAVAGGRNMADEYFFRSLDGNFIDIDLLVAGPAVGDMAAIFDKYWNSRHVYDLDAIEKSELSVGDLEREFEERTSLAGDSFPPLPPDARDTLGFEPLSEEIGSGAPPRMLHGDVRVFADDPEKVTGRSEGGEDAATVTSQVLAAIGQARSDLLLASPYVVPGARGLRGIGSVRGNGVAVTLITNTLAANDEPLASAAYARYRKPLLKMGVDIYEIGSRILKVDEGYGKQLGRSTGRSHAKLIVIDRRVTFVGSMNLDLRSSRENTELGMLVDCPELARELLARADRIRAIGTYQVRLDPRTHDIEWVMPASAGPRVLTAEPEVGWARRLEVLLLSPFVSEGLL